MLCRQCFSLCFSIFCKEYPSKEGGLATNRTNYFLVSADYVNLVGSMEVGLEGYTDRNRYTSMLLSNQKNASLISSTNTAK